MELPLAIKDGFGWYTEMKAVVQSIDVICAVTEPDALSINVFGV